MNENFPASIAENDAITFRIVEPPDPSLFDGRDS
jgi:hypothetical protein